MKKILFAAVVAALFCSCAKEETTVTPAEGKLVYRELTADIAPMSRAFLGEPSNGNVGVFLEEGDLVLFVGTDASAILPVTERLQDGSVKIAGEMPEGELKAYYPFWAYDNEKRIAWDTKEAGTIGSLHIDRTQFHHIAKDLTYYNDVAKTATIDQNVEMMDSSTPVAMKNESIAADAESFTFTADTNAAILEIPLTGDIMLEKILVYYNANTKEDATIKEGALNFNSHRTAATHELHFIHEKLDPNTPKSFYLMVTPGEKMSIALEFQSSSAPASAKAAGGIATDNWDMTGINDIMHNLNSKLFGFRYMRRMPSKTFTVGGVTKMPTVDLTLANLDKYRFVWKFGTDNADKSYYTQRVAADANDIVQYPTATDFMNLTANTEVTQGSNYVEVEVKPKTTPTDVGTQYTWFGNFGIPTGSGNNPNNDKFVMPVDAGNYRYFAVKTDLISFIQNTTDYWDSHWQKNVQLHMGYIKVNNSNVYYEKWQNRDCRNADTGSNGFSYVETGSDGVHVLVFDLMSRWRVAGNWLPTSSLIELHGFKICANDMKRTMKESDFDTNGNCTFENPKYKVYWMGYFTSIDEIKAFMKKN